MGISADGTIVVGESSSASGNEAFVWDAVNGVRAVKRAARAPDDFNSISEFGLRFEELVDIRKARRAERHAVLQEEKVSRPRPARQHGRANGGQIFNTAAAMNENAGNAIQDFARVIGVDATEFFRPDR